MTPLSPNISVLNSSAARDIYPCLAIGGLIRVQTQCNYLHLLRVCDCNDCVLPEDDIL